MAAVLPRSLRVRLRDSSGRAPVALDGSHGEGGGQILRTALALSVALARPVTISRIRAQRPKPGLQPQHLTAVRALAMIGDAVVVGDRLDSTEIQFSPRGLAGGAYRFDVGQIKGSAGSVTLIFQALLPALIIADAPSRLTLIGGTHVPWSPPVHYLTDVFLPAVRSLGVEVDVTLHRWGWYPAGGGEISVATTPGHDLHGLVEASVPVVSGLRALSAVSRLPRSIAERQGRRVEERLHAAGLHATIAIEEDTTAVSPGTLTFLSVPGRAGFCALGRRGLPAERVADLAVDELLAWRATGAAVDDHLADQLVPILALAGTPSSFTCPTLSRHLETVAWVVEQFLPVRVTLIAGSPARVEVRPDVTR
jgi:RNA 3'-terminal phosphate cyclase (ATP)